MSLKNKLILLIVLCFAFLAITFFIVEKNPVLLHFDTAIFIFINTIHFPTFLNTIMLAVTALGNPYQALAIFFVFALYLAAKRKKDSVYMFTIAAGLGIALPEAIKYLVDRARPISHLLLETDPSFPSSHATISAVYFCAAFLLLAPLIKNSFSRKLFILISVIIFPLVALSRIYLSVHWTSDVIAGILLGSVCYLFANIVVLHYEERA
jgi:undecaprenyl-diphosphatase